MNRYARILTALIFLAGVFISEAAPAQKILEDFKKPMPKIELWPERDFEAKTTLYEEVPMGDEGLAYKLRLPKNWTKSDQGLSTYSLSDKLFGEVARFYSPVDPENGRSRFTIQALELAYQLTAEQWFLQYLLANGYTIQGLETISEKRVEALYVVLEDDISYIVRAVAQINGKRVVLGQYYLPIDNPAVWEAEKKMQAQVISSFKLADPDEGLLVENMKTYQFLDIAEIKYPESWQLRTPPLRSVERMSADLLNVASPVEGSDGVILNGKIDIRLVSSFAAESLDKEMARFKDDLKESGLMLRDSIEVVQNYKFDPELEFAKVEGFEAVDANSSLLNYELWIAIMGAGDYYYFISLLTPSREQDYFTWARNTQTYKLVLEMTKPQADTLTAQ